MKHKEDAAAIVTVVLIFIALVLFMSMIWLTTEHVGGTLKNLTLEDTSGVSCVNLHTCVPFTETTATFDVLSNGSARHFSYQIPNKTPGEIPWTDGQYVVVFIRGNQIQYVEVGGIRW